MLEKLILKNEYRAARGKIFPTECSFGWYIRQRKDALIEAGAMLMIAGRWFVDPDVFDAFVVTYGKNEAKSYRAVFDDE